MKKLHYLLVAITFVLIGIAPAHAQLKPSSQSALARKVLAEQKYYMFDRVKTMCQEWPGCEKWALARRKANPSFTIIDAEVEYYVEGYNTWRYNLYVETMENLQTQTYVFVAKGDKFNSIPSEFKKFPGHPFTDMPSEHAKCVLETWEFGGPVDLPKNNKLRKRWTNSKMDNSWLKVMSAIEQQRVLWDGKNNPLWVRRLDWTPHFLNALLFPKGALIARQNKLGEAFEYIDAEKTQSILQEANRQPDFAFIIRH